LRDRTRVVAVGLARHCLDRVVQVPRLQQLDRKPGLAQRFPLPGEKISAPAKSTVDFGFKVGLAEFEKSKRYGK
jgi:hypothetical protein